LLFKDQYHYQPSGAIEKVLQKLNSPCVAGMCTLQDSGFSRKQRQSFPLNFIYHFSQALAS
jgi:hypothetical protein